MEKLETCQPHPSESTEHPPVPVHTASTTPAPLRALEVTFPGTGICPTPGMNAGRGAPAGPAESPGLGQGQTLPFPPTAPEGLGCVPQLQRLPKITHSEVAVAGHPQGSQMPWHSVSSRCPSRFSVYFVWLGHACGWSPSGRVSLEGLFPRLSAMSRAAFLSSRCARPPLKN